MLTDGGFNFQDNQESVVSEIENMVSTGGIYFCLFQIGPQTSFSNQLEERGVHVEYIKKAEDFMKKTIRFTKDLYRGVGA